MGLFRLSSRRSSSDHPGMATRIGVQGHMFIKRDPSQPFKRFWCVLRGSSLFVYSGQNDRVPKAVYSLQLAEIYMLGRVEDPKTRSLPAAGSPQVPGTRFRLQLVTKETDTDSQCGAPLHLAPALVRVTTPFDTQTETEMRDWYQALVSAKVRDLQETNSFRVAVVSGKVSSQSVSQSVSYYHTPSRKPMPPTHTLP
jgi:hypothetical protein